MPINRDGKTGKFVSNINTWVVNGDLAYCYLHEELLFFTDTNTYLNHLKGKSFSKNARGYSATRIKGKEVMVHRYITNAPAHLLVDHINRNKSDNRVSNLRLTNKSVNAFNSNVRKSNKSGVTGVWYRKDTGKWCAEIKVNYIKINLGSFTDINDAIKARINAEEKYYANK